MIRSFLQFGTTRQHVLCLFLGIFAVVVLKFSVGCTKKATESEKYHKSETLWVNWGTEPPTLDWTKANDVVSNNIIQNIMEPMVIHDFHDNANPIKPGLFESWTHTRDMKTWTFQLRKGVKWTDGVELTTQHVLDGFERLFNPSTGSEGPHFFHFIQGVTDYNHGKTKDFSTVGIKANNKNQVIFTLSKPLVFFPNILSIPNCFPIRKDVIAQHGDQWTEPQNMVTLGAYKVKEWQHDHLIVLERNEAYFGTPAKIKYIAGRMVNDLRAATELFEAGKLDLHRGIHPNDEKRLSQRPEFKIQPTLAILYLNLNTKKPPFNNKKARKALAYAIDREEILKLIGGHRRINKAFLPKGIMGSREGMGLDFNPSKAQKLFAELPEETKKSMKKFTAISNSNDTHKILLENVQSQLKKNLGLEIDINMEEWKVYLKTIANDPQPMFRLGFISLYPDPHQLMALWQKGSTLNYTGWVSETYDKVINAAAIETNPKKREQLYIDAQKILVDEVPFLTIYSATNLSLVSTRIANFQGDPMERWIFKNLAFH